MRGRNKPWAKDYINEHQDYLYKKNNKQPLTLEVGIGKGDFIVANAKANLNYDHIGVEINTSIFAMALKKIVNEDLKNVYLLNIAANKLNEYIENESIEKLYLNFSDPWPQNGYRKRRLVHPLHLMVFESLLKDKGMIYFKTDNEGLFEYGVQVFKDRNYHFLACDYDYQLEDGDYMSEYEAKFRSLGNKIYRAVVCVDKNDLHKWPEKN